MWADYSIFKVYFISLTRKQFNAVKWLWLKLSLSGRQKVAIIIPFRNRDAHLRTLLYYLHPMLMRQKLSYCIYVAEQVRIFVNEQFFLYKLI